MAGPIDDERSRSLALALGAIRRLESATITQRQATYWDVANRVRIHFDRKPLERRYVAGPFGGAVFTDDHPLLVEHRTEWADLYLDSPASDPESAIAEMAADVDGISGGWRGVARYLNRAADPVRLLKKGFGLFASAPRPYADAIAARLRRHGVDFSRFERWSPTCPASLLLLGRSYVVSTRFSGELLAEG